MASSAKISYPANEEEFEGDDTARDTKKSEDASASSGAEEFSETAVQANEEHEEDASGQVASNALATREFDISPEEFCGDPYEQQGQHDTRQELGRKGEEAAVKYLEAKGFEIIKRNWFCRFGEADIIARDVDGTLCFIEVKTRRSIEAGLPEEAITYEKRRRYERIALCYMMVSDEWDDNDNVRFDAIGICVTGEHKAMLRHHRSCFHVGI